LIHDYSITFGRYEPYNIVKPNCLPEYVKNDVFLPVFEYLTDVEPIGSARYKEVEELYEMKVEDKEVEIEIKSELELLFNF
jgi:hypothetical protein